MNILLEQDLLFFDFHYGALIRINTGKGRPKIYDFMNMKSRDFFRAQAEFYDHDDSDDFEGLIYYDEEYVLPSKEFCAFVRYLQKRSTYDNPDLFCAVSELEINHNFEKGVPGYYFTRKTNEDPVQLVVIKPGCDIKKYLDNHPERMNFTWTIGFLDGVEEDLKKLELIIYFDKHEVYERTDDYGIYTIYGQSSIEDAISFVYRALLGTYDRHDSPELQNNIEHVSRFSEVMTYEDILKIVDIIV